MLEFPSIEPFEKEMSAGTSFEEYGFVYVDRERWNTSPETTPLFLFTDDEAEEDDEQGMPLVATERGLTNLLAIADLEGVFMNFRNARPQGSVMELMDAINHYREYDAYKYL